MPLPPLGMRRNKPGARPRAAAAPAATGAPAVGAPALTGAPAPAGAPAADETGHQQSLAVDRLLLGCSTALVLDLVYLCVTARSALVGLLTWAQHVCSFAAALHRLWFVVKTYRAFLAGSLPAGSSPFLHGALHVSALASWAGWVRPLPLIHRVTLLLTRSITLVHVLATASRWMLPRVAGAERGAGSAARSGSGGLSRLVDAAATTSFVVLSEVVRRRGLHPPAPPFLPRR